MLSTTWVSRTSHAATRSARCERGRIQPAVPPDLDLTETALREWVRRAHVDRTKGRTGLTTAERDELARRS